ncbi:MAG: STAS domain-containing protein [Actinobacteria bacterium]|jgi:rsbT antagonist protein RsbS|nr:MAG: STAS domain-containing protein [Actinomycetota bacterium]
MPASILKQGAYLIASIQSALTDAEVIQLQDDLVEQVGKFRSRGVILDVSGLDVIDSFGSRTLHSIAVTTKLRGADSVIVGIRPDVAFAIVQLGLGLEGVHTALDLEEGLAFLNRMGEGGRRGG